MRAADVVLKDAQQLDLDSLYRQEPIGTWPPQDNAHEDNAPEDNAPEDNAGADGA